MFSKSVLTKTSVNSVQFLRNGNTTRSILRGGVINLNKFSTREISSKSQSNQESTTIKKDVNTKNVIDNSQLFEEYKTRKAQHLSDKAADSRLRLSDSKYDNPNYVVSSWKEKFGSFMSQLFKVDMDKSRSAGVSGGIYYSLCREQGLRFEGEPLSETASFYYEELGLPPTFSEWFQITILHEWMLFVRMRALPEKIGIYFKSRLVDRHFMDMEARLNNEMGIKSGTIVNKYLKDFDTQLRGAILSYDEGFYKNDAVLAAAIWRNLFQGDPNVNFEHLELMVRYVRQQLYLLSKLSDREFAFGKFQFIEPWFAIEPLTQQEEIILKEKVKKEFDSLENTAYNKSKLSLDN